MKGFLFFLGSWRDIPRPDNVGVCFRDFTVCRQLSAEHNLKPAQHRHVAPIAKTRLKSKIFHIHLRKAAKVSKNRQQTSLTKCQESL